MKNFCIEYDQIRSFMYICSQKSLMENVIFCIVFGTTIQAVIALVCMYMTRIGNCSFSDVNQRKYKFIYSAGKMWKCLLHTFKL